jgi:hypothetical protein
MRPYLSAKFLRVGNHLINLELIQQLELRKDDSAVITVPGPRKSYQRIEVPAPAGRKLWEFFSENLVVIDFEPEAEEELKPKTKARTKRKAVEKVKLEAVEGTVQEQGESVPAKPDAKAKDHKPKPSKGKTESRGKEHRKADGKISK